MNTIKTILFPTDLGRNAQTVFGLACSLAREHGARLVALHVIPARPLGGALTSRLAREQLQHTEADWEFNKREMERKLQGLRSTDATIRVEHLLKEGPRGSCILRTAEELGCDLLIMETHSKSEAERQVLGSVAAEIVCQPPCPVMLVQFPR
jgi:nucleotide-binding universal stress UspA family protein